MEKLVTLIERDPYSNLLKLLKDNGRVKILFGVRGSGKTCLLELLKLDLLKEGIEEDQIVHLNCELFKYRLWNSQELYKFLINQSERINGKKLYIMLDEIQNIPEWEAVINSFRLEIDCDIYVTGSNAYLVSSRFSTLLSGRTATLEILPFSFAEFLKVRGISFKRNENKFALVKWVLTDKDGIHYNVSELFQYYLRFGGLPSLTDFDDETSIEIELNEIEQTIITRDILQSRLLNKERNITDPTLLNQVFYYLLESIGNLTSFNKITNTLISHKYLKPSERKKPTNKTITAYTQALKEAFIIYEVKRFDVKGRKLLVSNSKFYSVDTGLRNQTLDYPDYNKGFEMENVVFLELKRRGYHLSVGKINNKEIDFLAHKQGKHFFIQVTESMTDSIVFNREIEAFKNLKEVGRKIVITDNLETPVKSVEDIEIIPIIDFLLDPSIL